AARLAEVIGIQKIVVPRFPGLFSAVGLLLADYRHEASRSVMQAIDQLDQTKLDGVYDELTSEVHEVLKSQSVAVETISSWKEIDLQYAQQNHSLSIILPPSFGSDSFASELRRAFEEAHAAAYGFIPQGRAYVASLRVRALATLRSRTVRD